LTLNNYTSAEISVTAPSSNTSAQVYEMAAWLMSVITLDSPDIFGHTIFCDDIRQEVGGKFTYVGVYSGFMFVQGAFPVVLPKLCFAITFAQLRDILIANVGIRIFLPGDTDSASVQADFQEIQEGIVAQSTAEQVANFPKPDEKKSFVAMQAKVVISQCTISQFGDIKVRALRDGQLHRLGSLRVLPAPQS
jgi:hypothetical protein